jgi:long-subunit fatty acid transport protein
VRSEPAARAFAAAALAVGLVTAAPPARAGGFELPDNGAQALGRGATFVAKADDGTAIYYNPAGLARQRGTRFYGGGNLFLHSFEFQRAGTFPDDPNNTPTPWGQKPFPIVSSSGGPYATPFVALSTDFASFDRFTVAIGAFSPPAVGNRTFPIATQGAPAASRYDLVQSRSTLLYPTASLAYRVTPWLDLGFSAHLVLAKYDETSVAYVDVGQCPNPEYQPCDSVTSLAATATTFQGTFGALLRPSANAAFGVSVRTPTAFTARGTLTPKAPRVAPSAVAPGDASLATRLPLIVRAGGRYIAMDGDFETYDLEVDATYEGWAAAQGDGLRLAVPSLGPQKNIDALIVHGYKSTFSVRAGGAYNFDAFDGVLALRAGAFVDSPATSFAYTRLDVDTLLKIAGTAGIGYRRGAIALDVGYAAVASVQRLVGTDQGAVRPLDLARNGQPLDSAGNALPAVNEGAYRGFTHVLAAGLTVVFDELFGAPRPVHFGNAYERGFVAPAEEAPPAPRPEREPAPRPKAELRPEPAPAKPKAELRPEPAAPRAEPRPEPPEPKAEPRPAPKAEPRPRKPKPEWWEELDN